jgi:hypothetical protein
MKFRPLALVASLCGLFTFFPSPAQSADSDVWGKSPEASDDRFTNPKSTLYAGPDGWYNTGEVRATFAGAASPAYQYRANFQEINGAYEAVKDLQTLHMDFGGEGRPAPGVYQIADKADPAGKTVRVSFADVSKGMIREWSAPSGAGTLTVSLVNGFTYFKCRNVALKSSDDQKPLTVGFEGALSPE